jgi:hypothetical protein
VDCYIRGKETHSILAPYKLLHDTAVGRRGLGKGTGSFQLVEDASGSQLGLVGNCVSYQVQLRATSYSVEQLETWGRNSLINDQEVAKHQLGNRCNRNGREI